MALVYGDEGKQFKGAIPLHRINKNAQWLKHLENLFYLKFIMGNPLATMKERSDASKEIEIAERKMKYWAHFSDFDIEQSEHDLAAVKRKWKLRVDMTP